MPTAQPPALTSAWQLAIDVFLQIWHLAKTKLSAMFAHTADMFHELL